MLHELGNLPWINIHTHHKPIGHDEWIIRNAYLSSPKSMLPEGYFFSCGIHPWFAAQHDLSKSLAQLERSLANLQCLALGESGLDRIHGPDFKVQQRIFDAQIYLAAQYKKPLIINSVKAHTELISMLHQFNHPVLIHGFNGAEKSLLSFLNKGFRISLGHRFFNNPVARLSVSKIPIDMLYFETDTLVGPVSEVYESYARLVQVDLNALRQQIWTNFTRDFNTDYGT